MMGPIETILRRAAERHDRAPCTGWYARTNTGRKCMPCNDRANSWCMLGAVFKERGDDDIVDVLTSAAEHLGIRQSLAIINDQHPHLAPDVWSEAIEAAAELGL